MKEKKERLQKVIAHSGFTSRRKAEKLIINGRVKVNNELITKLGTRVSWDDFITIDDIPLKKEAYVYYLFYKPERVISTVSDEKNRKTVIDFFPNVQERIYPVGRLDYDTSGLLLLTNDGEFANLLMHPKYEMEKTYRVKIKGVLTKQQQKQLIIGIRSKNDILKAIDVKVVRQNNRNNTSILKIVLHEGKNHHIRRMIAALKYKVLSIKRERLSFLTLGNLQKGEYRALTKKEVQDLKQIAKR